VTVPAAFLLNDRITELEAEVAMLRADRDQLRDALGMYLYRSVPVPDADTGRPACVTSCLQMREYAAAVAIHQGTYPGFSCLVGPSPV
jgi:hypothetical protein